MSKTATESYNPLKLCFRMNGLDLHKRMTLCWRDVHRGREIPQADMKRCQMTGPLDVGCWQAWGAIRVVGW